MNPDSNNPYNPPGGTPLNTNSGLPNNQQPTVSNSQPKKLFYLLSGFLILALTIGGIYWLFKSSPASQKNIISKNADQPLKPTNDSTQRLQLSATKIKMLMAFYLLVMANT
jgi:hypothetical protein